MAYELYVMEEDWLHRLLPSAVEQEGVCSLHNPTLRGSVLIEMEIVMSKAMVHIDFADFPKDDRSLDECHVILKVIELSGFHDQLNLGDSASAQELSEPSQQIEAAHLISSRVPVPSGTRYYEGDSGTRQGSLVEPGLPKHVINELGGDGQIRKEKRVEFEGGALRRGGGKKNQKDNREDE